MRLSFYCGLVLSSAILSAVCWRPAFAGDSKFHPPQTEAEKALHEIIDLEAKGSNLFAFALGIPEGDPAKTKRYGQFFTKAFLTALRKAEADLIQSNCGGIDREDEPCGFDFDPLLCAQDTWDVYVFRTIKAGEASATIIAIGLEVENHEEAYHYYNMTKEQEIWKLDGIDCLKGFTFNMPSLR